MIAEVGALVGDIVGLRRVGSTIVVVGVIVSAWGKNGFGNVGAAVGFLKERFAVCSLSTYQQSPISTRSRAYRLQ